MAFKNEWNAGDVPWVQKALHGSAFGSAGYAQCYFCGETSVKLSVGDLAADRGRVEVYCDNGNCDAREVVVIVARDNQDASRRADVRILDAIDADSHTTDPGPKWQTLKDIADAADDEGSLTRRLDAGPASYASPAR